MPTAGQVEVRQLLDPDMFVKLGQSVGTQHPPKTTPSVRSTAVNMALLKLLGAGVSSKMSSTNGTGKQNSTKRPHPPAIL